MRSLTKNASVVATGQLLTKADHRRAVSLAIKPLELITSMRQQLAYMRAVSVCDIMLFRRFPFFVVPRTYAYQSGHRGFGMAFCYREQPSRSKQRLYLESNRIITPHLWARDQEDTNPSRSRADLSDVEGPDAASHRRC